MSHVLVDLDGSLAYYESGMAEAGKIGAPIEPMVRRVRHWILEGKNVRIFTARVSIEPCAQIRRQIEDWCEEHIGMKLSVQHYKSYDTESIWDDRAVSLQHNTGRWCRYERDGIAMGLDGLRKLQPSVYVDERYLREAEAELENG